MKNKDIYFIEFIFDLKFLFRNIKIKINKKNKKIFKDKNYSKFREKNK
jgi:hypothetical protein